MKKAKTIVITLVITIILFSGCVEVPTWDPATCGDGHIDFGENCINCPQDVGQCPESSPGNQIQRLNIVYSGRIDNPGTKEFLAAHSDLVDTSFGHNTIAQWIKDNAENPNIKIIGYRDSVNGGTSEDFPEDYYLHSNTGARIHLTGPYPGHLMNVNPEVGWDAYSIQLLQSALSSNPSYDGAFMDDVIYNLESQHYGPISIDCSYSQIGDGWSEANWEEWMVSFMDNIKTTLGPDKIVMANCHIDHYPGDASGAMLFENFIHDESAYNTNGMTFTNGWNGGLLAIDSIHEAASLGTTIATHSGCSGGTMEQEEHWAQYCYAMLSFAAVDLNKTYFAWMFYGQDSTNGYWPFTEIVLGAPVNDYAQLSGHVYYREFADYYVIANLDNLGTFATFNFQGSHSLEGKHALFIPK